MAETYLDRGQRLLAEVKPYVPGITLDEAARRARVHPSRIAKLSSNENPLGPSPRAVAAIRKLATQAHYYPSPEAGALRAAIGRYLDVAPTQVVVGAGSSTLMHALVDAFTSPGGEVVSLDPGFTVYAEIAAIHGRRPVTVPLREHDFLLDLDRLRVAISPRTQLIFLTRPNNPTSTLIPLDVFAAAAELARRAGALIVSDEAYIEFADVRRPSAIALVRGREPRGPNVMLTRTFSKAFGLANLRLGYAVGTAETARCLGRANVKWATGQIAQAAGVAALADRGHLKRTLATVAAGRALLARGFADLGFPVAPGPQGNYIMVDVSARGFAAAEFAEALFRRGRVVVRGDFSPKCVRISIGRPDENRRVLAAVAGLPGAGGGRGPARRPPHARGAPRP
jgi:histidinol-phosphate aminotransferase